VESMSRFISHNGWTDGLPTTIVRMTKRTDTPEKSKLCSLARIVWANA
jgi:hypothetical protein